MGQGSSTSASGVEGNTNSIGMKRKHDDTINEQQDDDGAPSWDELVQEAQSQAEKDEEDTGININVNASQSENASSGIVAPNNSQPDDQSGNNSSSQTAQQSALNDPLPPAPPPPSATVIGNPCTNRQRQSAPPSSQNAIIANPYAKRQRQSTTTTTTTKIVNPYQKNSNSNTMASQSSSQSVRPHVNSQTKQPATQWSQSQQLATTNQRQQPILHPISQEDSVEPTPTIPRGLSPVDKFFTILLRHNTPQSYLRAAHDPEKAANKLWERLCRLAKLKVPTERIQPKYNSIKEHFDIRAALVLEEVRHEICEETKLRWEFVNGSLHPRKITLEEDGAPAGSDDDDDDANSSRTTTNPNQQRPKHPWISVQCVDVEWDKEQEISKVIFRPDKTEEVDTNGERLKNIFTTYEQSALKLMTILECTTRDNNNTLLQWGWVKFINQNSCTAFFYGPNPFPEDSYWQIRNLGEQNIPTFRQFVACTSGQTREVEFLDSVIGTKPTLASRNHDDKEQSSSTTRQLSWVGPELNTKQNLVVRDYLNCPRGTVQVVQGPPGCGKTTLLVSLIRNYMENRDESRKKLMVSAPTNKAVSVLAQKFIAETFPDGEEPKIGITILGDFDKLSDGLGKISSLRPFHLYQFLKVIKGDIGRILDYCNPNEGRESSDSTAELCRLVRQVQSRLKHRLQNLPQNVFTILDSLCIAMESYDAFSAMETLEEVRKEAQRFMNCLKDLDSPRKKLAVRMDLLQSTDLFFTTLISAGCNDLKNVMIDDLVVDEAAATTEPALYIPFRLNPQRMLVVGDPKQLPAVVISEKAEEFGLSYSLHERLMEGCECNYTLLDHQYRMHPEISLFPSDRFYNGKIINGEVVLGNTYGDDANVAFGGKPYVFHNVRGAFLQKGSLCENKLEAEAVVQIVAGLSRGGKSDWYSPKHLRIITFYHGQRALIVRLLREQGFRNVEVSTVDASQGSEADVVIVSFVRGGTALAGFLKDNRRINVALTRAKHQLICIANVYGLQEVAEAGARSLRLLSEDAQDRGIVRSRLS